jgi:hypothetical protein
LKAQLLPVAAALIDPLAPSVVSIKRSNNDSDGDDSENEHRRNSVRGSEISSVKDHTKTGCGEPWSGHAKYQSGFSTSMLTRRSGLHALPS